MLHPFAIRLWTAFVWRAWCTLCGIGGIALALAFTLVYPTTGDTPVSIHSNQRLITPKPIVGRSLIFIVKVDRREGCPGRIVDVYQRTDGEDREQIIDGRPIVTTRVAVTPNLKIAVPLPKSVTAGQWHYISTLVSDCPTRKREDKIIEVDFEAVPP